MCAVGSRPTVAKRSILDTQSLTSSKRNGTRNTKESCSTSQERAMAEVSGGTETAPGLAAWLQCVSHHHGHHKTYSRHRSRKVSGNSVFSFGRGRHQRVKKHITCACIFCKSAVHRNIRLGCTVRIVCVNCISAGVESSSSLLNVIFDENDSSISVLYESFSTLGFQQMWRHGCSESSVSGLWPCI